MKERALDWAAFKGVMEWTDNPVECDCGGPHSEEAFCFLPSENMADTWMVVEKMRERGFLFAVGDLKSGRWFVRFKKISPPPHVEIIGDSEHESATRAICLAALNAVGVEIPN